MLIAQRLTRTDAAPTETAFAMNAVRNTAGKAPNPSWLLLQSGDFVNYKNLVRFEFSPNHFQTNAMTAKKTNFAL